MNSLFSSFIDDLRARSNKQTAYKRIVQEGVKSIIGVALTDEQIVSLHEGVLTLRISPTVKSALLLKEKVLIEFFSTQDITVISIR